MSVRRLQWQKMWVYLLAVSGTLLCSTAFQSLYIFPSIRRYYDHPIPFQSNMSASEKPKVFSEPHLGIFVSSQKHCRQHFEKTFSQCFYIARLNQVPNLPG